MTTPSWSRRSVQRSAWACSGAGRSPRSSSTPWHSSPPSPASAGTVVDLGSGGGVPGLVIARARPDLRVVLVDRRSSRTDHLSRLVRRLGLDDRVARRQRRCHDPAPGNVGRRRRGPWLRCAGPHAPGGGAGRSHRWAVVVSEPPRSTERPLGAHDQRRWRSHAITGSAGGLLPCFTWNMRVLDPATVRRARLWRRERSRRAARRRRRGAARRRP